MRKLFWRKARQRYHGKILEPHFEYCMYGFSAIIVAIFAVAFLRNSVRTIAFIELGLVLALLPLIPALLHWRIRFERNKGRDALIEKDRALNGRSS